MCLFSICKATVSDQRDVTFDLTSDLNRVCKRMITLVINDMEQLLQSLVFVCDSCFYARKEHKSHSPSCHFIALKKKVEELSVEEFIKLQLERQKFLIVRTFRYERV